MRIGRCQRQVRREIKMQADIFHAEIVISQRQSFFEYLINLNGDALRLVLTRKAEQVLYDAMCALRLFVKLVGVFGTLRTDIGAASEQLAVAENRGEWVVEFVCDARDELADCRHFFAV